MGSCSLTENEVTWDCGTCGSSREVGGSRGVSQDNYCQLTHNSELKDEEGLLIVDCRWLFHQSTKQDLEN
jgi:hypothetical protein